MSLPLPRIIISESVDDRPTITNGAHSCQYSNQNDTSDWQTAVCEPVSLRLQVDRPIDCVCRLSKDHFVQQVYKFLEMHMSTKAKSQGIVISYGNGSDDLKGDQEYEFWSIINPEDDDSRARDSMILHDVYRKLVERGCNHTGREIRFTTVRR